MLTQYEFMISFSSETKLIVSSGTPFNVKSVQKSMARLGTNAIIPTARAAHFKNDKCMTISR